MAHPYLGREGVPFDKKVWEMLDKTMVDVARAQLAGRKFLPLKGPLGLGVTAVPLATKVFQDTTMMQNLPLFFIEKTFHLSKPALAQFEREGLTMDVTPLIRTVTECATLEDKLIFHGLENQPGLLTSPQSLRFSLNSWEKVGQASLDIINAVSLLDEAGFHGPYALALPPSLYNLLLRRYPAGHHTELAHIQEIVQDRVVKAPILQKGGVLVSVNEAYVSLLLGQDMQIGFLGIDQDGFFFSVSESLGLLVREPKSICVLE
ncbi:MAG: family 1 encapsulin nanocompartment shell protein [Candidatus Caldatribacteriaceae bacterium]